MKTQPPAPVSARSEREAKTLEQYGERVAAATRKDIFDLIDDDVIGCIKESHLIFGKACAMKAVTTAYTEMAEFREAQSRDAACSSEGRERVSADTMARLTRIAASGSEPGSNRNMMLTAADASAIVAALSRSAPKAVTTDYERGLEDAAGIAEHVAFDEDDVGSTDIGFNHAADKIAAAIRARRGGVK